MDPEATTGMLAELEQQFPVNSWTIDGVRVWPVVRSAIWWTTNANFAQQRQRLRAEKLAMRRFRQLRQTPYDWARGGWHRLADGGREDSRWRRADVVILGDNGSRIPIEGSWYDRLCQPFIEELAAQDASSLHLEPHHIYRNPRGNNSVRIQVQLDALWMLSRLPRRRHECLDAYERLHDVVQRRVGPAAGLSLSGLRREVDFLLRVAQWFGRVLDEVEPRFAMNVDISTVQMAFHLACWRRGITSVEIQHGAFRASHALYSGWTAVPDGGFELLPAAYWVWGEHEAAIIRAWSAGVETRHEPLIGGNAWLRQWLEGRSDLVARFDAVVRGLRSTDAGAVTLLVAVSTGATGKDDLRPVREAILASPSSWTWWIRQHPTMSRQEMEDVRRVLGVSSRVMFDEPSRLPLYALLRAADVHVTQLSSVVVEAAAFGVPTVLTDAGAASTFAREVEAGWAVLADSGQSVVTAVDEQLARRSRLSPLAALPDRSTADVLRELLDRASY